MTMTIGLTYDLRSEYLAEGFSEEETAEFDRDDTVTAIETTIRSLGYQTERIGHGRQLAAALAAGRRWDLVFNIAEGLHGIGREAQVPALLDMYRIPYTFSDPLVMSLTLHKGEVLGLIGESGAGKSTIGRQLARSLHLRFLDSDREIEERTGASIPLIFELEGEQGFRKREQEMIAELCQKQHIVLATGGGGSTVTVTVSLAVHSEIPGAVPLTVTRERDPGSMPAPAMISGTRMPPSKTEALPRLRGLLLVTLGRRLNRLSSG